MSKRKFIRRGSGKDGDIPIGFEMEMIVLRPEQIVPLKVLPPKIRESVKYKQVVASLRSGTLIEHPVVTQDAKQKDRYILLDGHMRLEALKELGAQEITCLVSTDDESFTYNKHVNRISTVQEHRMMLRAIRLGVPEALIAQRLNVDVGCILRKRTLLEGICPEVIEMFKDKVISPTVFVTLRKMVPYRQVEVAELMNDSDIYSITYARAALAATPKEQLVNPQQPKKVRGLSAEQMDRMENEMGKLQRIYRLTEDTYGKNVMNLTLAKGYLTKLLGNARIVRYLAQQHHGILQEFQKISEIKSLPGRDTVTS
jgi:hypothetical protein